MNYYLDCEFNGFKGELISMALVSETGLSLCLVMDQSDDMEYDPWVKENVMNNIFMSNTHYVWNNMTSVQEAQALLESYFKGDNAIHVIADWPDDIKYLSDMLLTGPGTMINIPGITFEVKRVDAWPNDFPEDVVELRQHNAWCDAVALRYKLTGETKLLSPPREFFTKEPVREY